MIIGNIRLVQSKSGPRLEGYINTLQFAIRFHLHPLPKTDKPEAPAYRVIATSDAGVEVDIGAVWVKSMKKAGREGEEFLSLTLDDPSFPKPLNVAAFKDPVTGEWNIMFRRRQDRAA